MKILHIAPNAPYNDYWGYQDNLLPKHHKKLGHDVTIIITNTMHKDGKIVEIPCDDYVLNDGVRVIRMKKKKYAHRILTNLKGRLFIFDHLKNIRPDFIFYHSLSSETIYDVIKYKKKINPECVIVQDNHADYYNSPIKNNWKGKLIRSYYRFVNRRSVPYVSKVYGVTPWRKTFAEDYYGIPKSKTDVLIMGADDEKIDFNNRTLIRENIRKKYGISDDDFLIVTGGKIDKNKKITLLMEACSEISKVKLIVFGSLSNDIKEDFEKCLRNSNNIIYVGWIDADKVYDYFMASELVCFPGTHSVMWEQACACKIPCLFERWEGMEHVNNGGNSDFVYPVTSKTLKQKIFC